MGRGLAQVMVAIGIAIGGATALACPFHTGLPAETVIDRLLASDAVLRARPDPADPFRFQVSAVLLGTGPSAALPHLVNSAERRRLRADPRDSVLFARDPETGSWNRLAYLDAAYGEVIDTVLRRSPAWSAADDVERARLFAPLIAHPNRDLQALALAELDRVDYRTLRALEVQPEAEPLLAGLANPYESGLIPIRLLLLGFTVDPAGHDVLRTGFDRGLQNWSPRALGALVVGLVELDGTAGVQRIAGRYFGEESQPLKEIELVVEALAIQRNEGVSDLAPAIDGSLAQLLETRPEAAPAVARQLAARADWSQHAALERVLADRQLSSVAGLFAVSTYVAMARANAQPADLMGRQFEPLER